MTLYIFTPYECRGYKSEKSKIFQSMFSGQIKNKCLKFSSLLCLCLWHRKRGDIENRKMIETCFHHLRKYLEFEGQE